MRGFIALSGCGQSTGASSGLRELDASWPTLMRKISRKSTPLLICTAVAARCSMIPVGADSKMLFQIPALSPQVADQSSKYASSNSPSISRSSINMRRIRSFCGSSHRPSPTIWFNVCPACANSFSDLRSNRSAISAIPTPFPNGDHDNAAPYRNAFGCKAPQAGSATGCGAVFLRSLLIEARSTLTTNSPESGLNFQVTGNRPRNRRLGLPAARQRVGALDALRQRGSKESVDVAIEDRAGVAGFDPGAQILHHLIGLQHVRADLVAPADIGFRRVHCVGCGLALLQFALIEPGAQHRKGMRPVLVLRPDRKSVV